MYTGAASGADKMYVRNLFHYMFPTFVEAIEKEMQVQVVNVMLTAFYSVGKKQTIIRLLTNIHAVL